MSKVKSFSGGVIRKNQSKCFHLGCAYAFGGRHSNCVRFHVTRACIKRSSASFIAYCVLGGGNKRSGFKLRLSYILPTVPDAVVLMLLWFNASAGFWTCDFDYSAMVEFFHVSCWDDMRDEYFRCMNSISRTTTC